MYKLCPRERALSRIGLFHVHVTDKGGFCLLCGYLARPEKQGELADWEPEYDDMERRLEYERGLLRRWGYTDHIIGLFLSYETIYEYEGVL